MRGGDEVRSFRDKLLVAVGRVTIPVLAVAAGWGAAAYFPVASGVFAAVWSALWLDRRFGRGRLGRAVHYGAWWFLQRVADAVAATPVWVFVAGPRLVLNLAVVVLCMWGLSAVTGASMNPLANVRDLGAMLDRGRAP